VTTYKILNPPSAINRIRILEHGFKIPRSLVIPYEYLQSSADPERFTLEQIDKYFPGWKRMVIRSNAPDEDLKFRFPGMYVSDSLRHTDVDYSRVIIQRVLKNYDRSSAKMRRQRLGLPERGMCLLVQESISDDERHFAPAYTGVFSDVSDKALLLFNQASAPLESMQKPPRVKFWVNEYGKIDDSHNEFEADLAYRLRKLAQHLPKISGKGWEIEFVGKNDGTYVVQTTPIFKKGRAIISQTGENIFDAKEVIGTNEMIVHGILYLPQNKPSGHELEKLVEFDVNHPNYCLAAPHLVITNSSGGISLFDYIIGLSAVLDIGQRCDTPFAPHLAQFLREGRVAMNGKFNNGSALGNLCLELHERVIMSGKEDIMFGPHYSPTRLVIRADEISNQGYVALADGKVNEFVPIRSL